MKENIRKAIKEYECLGCVNGPALTCYEQAREGCGCAKHCPGTFSSGIGAIILGLPKGFDRVGPVADFRPFIFETYQEDMYDLYNIPVWKHLNADGHTLVRGLMPRRNEPFLHIFLENCMDKIQCQEITEEEQKGMD